MGVLIRAGGLTVLLNQAFIICKLVYKITAGAE